MWAYLKTRNYIDWFFKLFLGFSAIHHYIKWHAKITSTIKKLS